MDISTEYRNNWLKSELFQCNTKKTDKLELDRVLGILRTNKRKEVLKDKSKDKRFPLMTKPEEEKSVLRPKEWKNKYRIIKRRESDGIYHTNSHQNR